MSRHRGQGRYAARRSAAVPLLASAVLGAMLPLGSTAVAGPVVAPLTSPVTFPVTSPVTARVAADDGERAFGGYRASASASPVKLEIYEPSIPIPSSPQVELELGYSAVEGDSGSSQARASFVWPGDPVGEGFKTFVEQLGFPPQLGEDGYPVQVNATHPGGEEAQRDEPFPGMLQRAEAGEGTARAVNGFSPDGEPQDVPDDGDDNDDETGGGGGIPGLPELPGLPGLSSGSGSGSGLLGVLGGSSAAADTPGLPGLPPEVAALVDVEGFTTVSSLESGDRVVARSRAAVGRVSLLGGLITSSGVTSLATTRGDGDRTVATGETTYGDLVVLGQRFRHGPDGFEAVGNPTPIPGLPDQAGAALGQLGITVGLPAPTLEEDGDEATATAAGLVIEIDLARFKGNLAALPLGDLVGALPDEARELKDALSLLTNISSRMVVTLGMAQSTVETTPPLDPPPPPDGEEETDGEEEATAGGGGGGGGAGLGATGGTDAGGPSPDSSAPVAAAGGVSTVPLSATPGLPPLFSIPGLLLMGALALAAVGGGYVRKLGVLALGGGAPCPHGLDSGLPDLRKA